MPQASSRPKDPYKNFKFRVSIDGKVVAGVSKVSALKRTTEVISHVDGNDMNSPRLSPGHSKYDPITMERGLTFDPVFMNWANQVHSLPDGKATTDDFRKNIILEVMDLLGNVVGQYEVYECWVSEYQLSPELDANANAIAIEHIVIQNEGSRLVLPAAGP